MTERTIGDPTIAEKILREALQTLTPSGGLAMLTSAALDELVDALRETTQDDAGRPERLLRLGFLLATHLQEQVGAEARTRAAVAEAPLPPLALH